MAACRSTLPGYAVMTAEAWGVWIAGAGLFLNAWQIWRSRQDANLRAAMSLLEDVDGAMSVLIDHPIQAAQRELLERYRRTRDDLTPGAKAYLRLLTCLDRVAISVTKNLVNGELVQDHLKTLIRGEVVSATFLQEFCDASGDDDAFCDLRDFIHRFPFRGDPPRHLKA